MGTEAWPSTIKPLVDGYEAGPLYTNTVQTARDRSELRVNHGTGWSAEFIVRVTSAQRTTLLAFFASRKGSWDSFPFTAPDDGQVRQVRFAEDALAGRRLAPNCWEYSISIVSVVV